MAIDFNGSTDRIDYTGIYNWISAFSFSAMVYLDDQTPAAYQYISTDYTTGTTLGLILSQVGTVSGRIDLAIVRATTNLNKSSVNDAVTSGQWMNLIATYDGGTAHSGIHIYKDGTELSYQVGAGFSQDGSGALATIAGDWSVGGRTSDDLRNLDGRLAAIGRWTRVLGPGEIAALANGWSPANFPSGLKIDCPFIRSTGDSRNGAAAVVDGTAVVAHPRIIYPRRSRSIFVPAAAAVVGSDPTPLFANRRRYWRAPTRRPNRRAMAPMTTQISSRPELTASF